MSHHSGLPSILRQYPAIAEASWADSAQWQRHIGLSGGEIWRVPTSLGNWGVRLWPPDFPLSRLPWIHRVLEGLQGRGLPIPIPFRHRGGGTWVATDVGIWQVEPWLPGQADFAVDPRNEKLAAACRFLAAFHRETASTQSIRRGLNPALERRISALQQHAARWPEYTKALQHARAPRDLCAAEILRCAQTQAPRWLTHLQAQPADAGELIPCIRDIWHDHVLYLDQQVSGVVDFGALDFDTPATDLARLLGSLVGDDRDRRRWAIEQYLEVRPLSAMELEQIDLLDRSGVLIAGLNWVHWLWIEHRAFEADERIDRRLADLASRLRGAAFEEPVSASRAFRPGG